MELNKNSKIPGSNFLKENGSIFLVNKPMGWSSFDVVKKMRIHFGVKKVGHAGTLDPKATGLLIVGMGKKTKQISDYTDMEKEYEAVMVLGASTASYDAETEIIKIRSFADITKDDVNRVLKMLTGVIMQKPPMYSAIKLNGKPLYKYARKGREIELEAREVEISQLELIDFQPPEVKLRVVCSKGTYIRSLANDIGEMLGCGGHLNALVRTRIGHFLLDDAFSIEELTTRTLDNEGLSINQRN
ncbi:MAG: tRNA pseudouridine(55) synthase TruB [Bacteroidota bacterium]|nr:tRNA pseudouridine(55) synthase TruB [Bacteroidota bacterium]